MLQMIQLKPNLTVRHRNAKGAVSVTNLMFNVVLIEVKNVNMVYSKWLLHKKETIKHTMILKDVLFIHMCIR